MSGLPSSMRFRSESDESLNPTFEPYPLDDEIRGEMLKKTNRARTRRLLKEGAAEPNGRRVLLTKQEAADYFGVVPRTVDLFRERGMPSVKLGKTVRFELSEINDWIDRTRQPQPQLQS